MSYIIENTVKGHTYLYECESWREGRQIKGRRKIIGKIDIATGERRFKPDYIERMRTAGTPVDISETEKIFSVEDVRKSSVLECGLFHLFECMSEKNGLLAALLEAMPKFWQEIFMLASHLAANGEAFMHCEDWLAGTESFPVGSMSSQRISELLATITLDMRERFYQAWCRHRQEKEYLALDITSVSSYSELIEDVEWGYNRDGEDLPQVNICLLMGEDSKLPIYQTVYAGSIRDVSTLLTTLAKFDRLVGEEPILSVMDKGFYSRKNVTELLCGNKAKRFIVAVPFTAGFAKDLVANERRDIDTVGKAIHLSGQTLRAVTKERTWLKGGKVFAHVYFSPKKALKRREDIFGHVAMLREEAEKNPGKCAALPEHKRYLNIRKSERTESGYTVSIREGIVESALGTEGWLVLLSNDVSGAREALRIYRAKDVVEKGFLRLKVDLDLGRLRVHGQERMQNKVFIGFISLVLVSAIHSVMMNKGLYETMTMRQLIRTLSKHRVQLIGRERLVYPATKTQKDIYDAFEVSVPM
jgi:transposase